MPDALPEAGLRESLLWLLGRRQRFGVRGRSMLPGLPDGATVLVERGATPQVGDVVVAAHPFVAELKVIKRVAEEVDGRLRLRGDNPQESSHDFGPVERAAVVGVVRSRLPGG